MERVLHLGMLVVLSLFMPPPGLAEPPSRPFSSFDSAKKVARDAIYADHPIDFYCGCSFERSGRSSGTINRTSCGYQPRRNPARGAKMEWEHIVPAFYFGHARPCWSRGNARCVKNGKRYRGRECCAKVDKVFQRIEADLHNLAPSVGELNGDRSNLPYGLVSGEPRAYGACDFEIGGKPRVAEPADAVRGDAARIWLYMASTYGIKLTNAQRKVFQTWADGDPPDDWERLRDRRVAAAQGNKNAFVK